METWDRLLEDYAGAPDVGSFSKLTRTAEAVLKEDLARFEIELIASTLLYSPVSLLEVISTRQNDPVWTKPLTDAFKVLTLLVQKYPDAVFIYHGDIVKSCQVPLEARARAGALSCLSACVERSLSGLHVSRYVAELESPVTCKAPLAALVGAIVEFHPEEVVEEYYRVWRAYLALLEGANNTEAVCGAALRGARGVLRHFGDQLPLCEAAALYGRLAGPLYHVPACRDVVVEILSQHAGLFRELVSRDAALRACLWASTIEHKGPTGPAGPTGPTGPIAALLAVYEVAVAELTDEQLRNTNILHTEVCPYTSHALPRVKFTALRILRHVRLTRGVNFAALDRLDVYELEFQLRSEIDNVPVHVAEAVSFCVESRMAHSAVLVQTAILFHHKLPPAGVKDIIARGLQAPPGEEGDVCLEFLISESCIDLELYMPVWNAVLSGEGGEGVRARLQRGAARDLRAYVEGREEQPPEALVSLLAAAARVLGGQCPALAVPLCAAVRRAPLPITPAMLLLPLLPVTEEVEDVYKSLDIWRMPDSAALCACACALLHAPRHLLPSEDVLYAVQVILSKGDSEAALLSIALRRLAALLDEREGLGGGRVAQVMVLVQRLRSRADLKGKEGRELRWEVDMFLGKYYEGSNEQDEADELDELMSELKDQLTLTVPGLPDQDDYKVDLQGAVLAALEHGDRECLATLAAVICAEPSLPSSPALLRTLAAVLSGAAGGPTPPPLAPPLPALAPYLLQHISSCRSPDARRVLCDMLQPLLRADMLRRVARDVCDMLVADTLLSKLAGLDVSVAVISALKEDSLLTRDHLPAVLLSIATTNELAAARPFDLAAALYADSVHVFGASALDSTLRDLLHMLVEVKVLDVTAYKATVDMSVNFIKKIIPGGSSEFENIESVFAEVCDGDSAKCLYVLTMLHRSCGVGSELAGGVIVQKLFALDAGTDFEREAVLVFVAEFADVLLEHHNEETTWCVGRVVSRLPLRGASAVWRPLGACISAWGGVAPGLAAHVGAWVDRLPLGDIEEHLRQQMFPPEDPPVVSALLARLDALLAAPPAALLAAAPRLVEYTRLLYEQADIEPHVWYLTDVLSVALRFLPVEELKRLLLAGPDRRGLAFCREFMPAFYRQLVRKPFVLCSTELRLCCALLRDVLQHAAVMSRDTGTEHALELADELFEWYAAASSPEACAAVVRLAVRLGAASRGGCVRGAASRVADPRRPMAERCALLSALPPGDDTNAAVLSFCSALPARLAECRGTHAGALRALLDPRAAPSRALLAALAALPAGGESGWWDGAMSLYMTSLARRADAADALLMLYDQLDRHPLSTGVCDRLLAPLISKSPPAVVERFFSPLLPSLLRSLSSGQVPPAALGAYHRCVVSNIRTVTLLRLMVEKVPRTSLEAATSVLHSSLGNAGGNAPRPWLAVREVCKLCSALQARTVLPPGAEPALAAAVLSFQQASYNTLVACVCAWRADARLFARVCGRAWDALVGSERYALPLRSTWNRRSLVAGAVGGAAGAPRPRGFTGGSTAGTPRGVTGGYTGGTSVGRQRVFLTTLSECPLNFDLFYEEGDPCERVELVIFESELNRHPCAASITALLRHLAAYPDTTPSGSTGPTTPPWVEDVCNVLRTGRTNVRWLIAQCVVNVSAELEPFSSALGPALLALVCDTGELNSLHVDIISTVSRWPPPTPPPPRATLRDVVLRVCVASVSRRGARLLEALLHCCEMFLKVFPEAEVVWETLRPHLDDPEDSVACYRLLLRASQAGVYIPELIPELLRRIGDRTRDTRQVSRLARLFSAAVRAQMSRDSVAARQSWEQFAAIVSRDRRTSVARYIALLHGAQDTAPEHFQAVCDIATKAAGERAKCVSVLLGILRAHPALTLGAVPSSLREQVAEKGQDLAFEEVFRQLPPSPPAKRARLSPSPFPSLSLSPLLGTRSNEREFANILSRLDDKAARLDGKMCTDDMRLRFVECYYAYVYLPLAHPAAPAAPAGGPLAELVTSLVRVLRTQPRYLRATIPHGASRAHLPAAPEGAPEEAPLTVGAVLQTLLDFGKRVEPAGAWLAAQLWRACSPNSPADAPADVLADMLAGSARASPAALRLAAELAPTLPNLERFRATVARGAGEWTRSEAAPLLQHIEEELALRTQGALCDQLGDMSLDEESELPAGDQEFSIEGLVRSFGALSHWHTRACSERAAAARLPPLWTTRDRFRRALEEYSPEGEGWFSCMVHAWRGSRRVPTRGLRAAAAWPTDPFQLAAVTEAVQYAGQCGVAGGTVPLRAPAFAPGDCLAEWAARLMMRSLYLGSGAEAVALSRSHELLWCARATEMQLARFSLQAVRRNTESELPADAVVPWLGARVAALKSVGEEGGHRTLLEKACRAAELHGPAHFSSSPPLAIIQLNLLVLQLRDQLGTSSDSAVSAAMQAGGVALAREPALCERDHALLMIEMAILHYYTTRAGRDLSTCIVTMCDILRLVSNQSSNQLSKQSSSESSRHSSKGMSIDVSVALVLATLGDEDSLTEHAATYLRDTLAPLQGRVAAWLGARGARAGRTGGAMDPLDQWRRRIALLCGAEVVLLHHCTALAEALRQNDMAAWEAQWSSMQREVFDNEDAGTDYRALRRHRAALEDARDKVSRPSECRALLQAVCDTLRRTAPRGARSVPQLCPTLAHPHKELEPLLGGSVLEHEIPVFVDSVSLPGVLSTRGGGTRRRFLLKRERAAVDARAAAAAHLLFPRHGVPQVIPLTAECALTEYLEGHERVRALIGEEGGLTGACEPRLAPAAAEREFARLCAAVPPAALRRALRRRSGSVERFARVQRRFLRDFADMTLLTALFGVGDRHLNNMLVCGASGSVRGVDWGATFQYCAREPPPARITRALRAVAPPGLVAALERVVREGRQRGAALGGAVRLAFEGGDYNQQLSTVEALLLGRMLPCDAVRHNGVSHATPCRKRDVYAPQEQVSCLLRLCTDPRALALTRPAWEPWL